MFVYYNPNPRMIRVEDCVVRAISKLLDMDWDTAYLNVAKQGFKMKNMPSINAVWGEYLRGCGYRRRVLPDTCPDCYSVQEFCRDYDKGRYLLATGSHVVAVIDGNYYDTWDSGDETPIYYFEKVAE